MYPRPESFIGREVDGHRIDAVLGRGGMGIVFKAENVELSRSVALKIINPALAQDDSFIRRFRLEARALAQIHHPNIVLVYAFRPFDMGYYISMEYVHGPTLAEYLDAHGALSWQESVYLLKQMLSAFHFAHSAGVIHRDIKPRNILLAANNVVKITDFGLAKVLQEGGGFGHDTTVTVATGGTIHYMPPEQIKGLKNVDHRGDIFSLGMSMYESLTGMLPFDKNASGYTIQKIIVEEPFPDIRKTNPAIPRSLARIIMKALEKDPDKRYQSAAEMKTALEEFENEQHSSVATTVFAPGAATSSPGVTLQSSRGRFYSMAAATAVCLGLIFLFFYLPNRDAPASGSTAAVTPGAGSRPPLAAAAPLTPEVIPETGALSADTALTMETTEPRAGEDTSSTTALPLASPDPGSRPYTPPVAVTTGMLTITSTPPGARIRIDGVEAGVTPDTIPELPAGPVQITLDKEAFLATTIDATVTAGDTTVISGELLPIQGTLQLLVAPSGSVYIDSRLVAENVSDEFEVRLPPGGKTLSIRHPTYGEWRRDITITPNDPTIVSVDFTQTIRLVVTSLDVEGNGLSGEIYLDGAPTGLYTPWPFEVPVGLRTLEVRADGYTPLKPPEPLNFDSSITGPIRFMMKRDAGDGRP